MLKVEKLQVRADASSADLLIDGLSLSVNPGEAVGVVGPSGCGKTTLLRAIAGLIDPAGGVVSLDGKTAEAWGYPAFRRWVGLVPQRPVVWGGSVNANLQRPYSYQAVDAKFDESATGKMLEALGLSGMRGAEAGTLSEGEQQRLCLVRALLMGPGYLLLDEPTSALDEASVGRVEALLIRQMDERGLGVLIVTHDRTQAGRLCSSVIDLASYAPGVKAGAVADV